MFESILMPVASFLAALLVLLPLPGHWQARNIPTISIVLWLFALNVAHGVNTIAWAHNTDVKLVVWCDIVTRIDTGANVALPAACLCICMHLERVASIRMVRSMMSDKRRRMLVDAVVCWGIPTVYVVLYYIVQGHRFDIIEDFGCRAEDYVSIPEFFLVWFPPIVLALATLVFAGLSFLHFFRRRATFAKHLNNSSGGLSPGRYFRLMSMSVVQMFWSLLIVSLTCWFNYRDGLRPWTSWDDVHFDFSRIDRYPLVLIPPATLRMTQFLWWAIPVSTFLFLAFFAFGQDAMREYKRRMLWIRRVLSFRKLSRTTGDRVFAPVSSSTTYLVKTALASSQNSTLTVSAEQKRDWKPLSTSHSDKTLLDEFSFADPTLPHYDSLPSAASAGLTPAFPSTPITSSFTSSTLRLEPLSPPPVALTGGNHILYLSRFHSEDIV